MTLHKWAPGDPWPCAWKLFFYRRPHPTWYIDWGDPVVPQRRRLVKTPVPR